MLIAIIVIAWTSIIAIALLLGRASKRADVTAATALETVAQSPAPLHRRSEPLEPAGLEPEPATASAG